MLYAFFWVIPRCLNFICRRFGTLCLFHFHRQVGACTRTYLSMKMEQTVCSETSAYKIEMLGNHPKESILLSCWCNSAVYLTAQSWLVLISCYRIFRDNSSNLYFLYLYCLFGNSEALLCFCSANARICSVIAIKFPCMGL